MSIAAAAKTVAAATRSMSAEAAAKAATAAAAGISTIDGVERFVYNSKGMVKSFAVEDMRPTKLDHGKWKKPALSGLDVARIRKEVRESGQEWPFDKEYTHKPVVFKGQKYLLNRPKRYENIQKNMEAMPAKVEEYYKQMRARRKHLTDLHYVLQHGFGKRSL